MEIATHNSELINNVSAQYRVYIEAMRTPDLKSQSPINNYTAIYDAIVMATELLGSKQNEDNGSTRFIAESLLKELVIKYPYARHGEIALAFKKGVLGEYKDKFPKEQFFAINVSNLWKCFKFYIESPELLAAKREWIELVEIPKSDIPKGKICEVDKEAILSVFNDYKSKGELPIYSRVYYSALLKLKGVETLITDKETRTKIVKETKLTYEKWLKESKLHKKDPEQFNVLMGQMNIDNKSYLGFSQKIALRYYFNECINQNINPL